MSILIFLVNLIGFGVLTLALSFLLKEKIATVVPVSFAVLSFVLFILAFFGAMKFIDVFFCVVVITSTIYYLKQPADRKKEIGGWIFERILDLSIVVIIFSVLACFFLLKDRVCIHGDDYRAWALEAKYLFYANGFASADKLATVDYAAYYPGLALIKYWFVHIRGSLWREGMMYVAYWALYFSCLYPMLDLIKLTKKNVVPVSVAFTVLAFLFPNIIDVSCYEYSSPELILSVLFALSLYNFARVNESSKKSVFIQNSLIFMEMVLVKSTGLMWAVVSVLFFLYVYDRKKIKECSWIFVPTIIVVIIWKVFCKINERSNYYVTAFCGAEDAKKYLGSLCQALFMKINSSSSAYIPMSAIFLVVLLIGIIFLFEKVAIISIEEKTKIVVFFLLNFMTVFLVLVYFAMFVFREDGYFDPIVMTGMVSRYGEPGMMGFAILLIYLALLRYKNSKVRVLLSILLVIIVAGDPMGSSYRGIVDYQSSTEASLSRREEGAEEIFGYTAVDAIKAEVEQNHNLCDTRMMLVTEYDQVWIYPEMAYEFSPMSMVYLTYDDDYDTLEDDLMDYYEDYKFDVICYNIKSTYEEETVGKFSAEKGLDLVAY